MSADPLITQSLIIVVLETLFYGFFLFLTSVATITFIQRRYRRSGDASRPRSPMIVGALGLFIFVTGHWLLTIFDLFQAFVGFKDGTQPVEYYNDPSAASRVTRVVFLSFTILIADSLMVYRLWIIWAFNVPVVIFPCLTIMGYLGQ
uniref:Uncharacterized protein n=1 Tax=Moniliophthora roreri TaxID=221103 RepID=A0A0W0G7C7_MONRR